jgi:hypothetical protein
VRKALNALSWPQEEEVEEEDAKEFVTDELDKLEKTETEKQAKGAGKRKRAPKPVQAVEDVNEIEVSEDEGGLMDKDEVDDSRTSRIFRSSSGGLGSRNSSSISGSSSSSSSINSSSTSSGTMSTTTSRSKKQIAKVNREAPRQPQHRGSNP